MDRRIVRISAGSLSDSGRGVRCRGRGGRRKAARDEE